MSAGAGLPGMLDAAAVWRLLLAARATAGRGELPTAFALGFDANGRARVRAAGWGGACIHVAEDWQAEPELAVGAAQLLDLHLPLIRASARGPLTIAQLGQSLDGRIATQSGHSHYVTGAANRDHLHRLRALADAVVVGAGTVEYDDPQLTVRRVEGTNPVRVVLDPHRRLPAARGVFADGRAPSLRLCGEDAPEGAGCAAGEVVRLPTDDDGAFAPAGILDLLHARGLRSVLVEGGGITVSRFLAAGRLDRLHLAVAPLILGSGRPAVTLPAIDDIGQAIRPAVATHPMGADTLFDCVLRGV